MAKKTRSERKAKQKQDAAVKEKEARLDDEDDDEDDDDDEEETLNMAAEADAPADPDLMHIEFSFFDPRESDFHGMRNLLSGGGLIPSAWDVGGMAGILCEQAEVGGVVKTVGKGSDEPDDDVLGFLSVVNLHTHRDSKCVQQVCKSMLQRIADQKQREIFQRLMEDQKQQVGICLSERMINLPPELVPNLFDSLLQDIEWASANAPKAERASFCFSHLLLVCHVLHSVPAASAGASSSSAEPERLKAGGKKRKRANEAAQAELIESLEFGRAEEQVLAMTADHCALLNGSGQSRQLLLMLTPSAMREALPGLHMLMGTA